MSDPVPGTPLREEPATAGAVPFVSHADWSARFPWLIQGTTSRGDDDFDVGLAGVQPVREALGRWWAIRDAFAVPTCVVARQVHGRDLIEHGPTTRGIQVCPPADGHVTTTPGVLLAVTIADCVPVSIVAPDARAIALLHAGWRGTAAGILEAGLAALRGRTGAGAHTLHVHMGPAICGRCYEVGPEVPAALGLDVPPGRTCVDIRADLARRAVRNGVPAAHVSYSTWCTRCDRPAFFSHRGGDPGRQAGLLGIRSAA